MSLSAGMRLGPYEVAGLIGQGGMGEVYRARDSRLDRDVALKVLPDQFADHPDRLLRFQREAKALGLAKALDREPAAEGSQSPTITSASTRDGVIIGTAAYMSPEQARGRPADRRADIWAFGAVLFEMLTGRRAFERETVADTVAAIIETEPG
jgi:serine/threonine protein kinase